MVRCPHCSRETLGSNLFCPTCGGGMRPADGEIKETRPIEVGVAAPPPLIPPEDGGLFAPGDVLSGRYRVVMFLGRGGMGEVYRADDLALGQPVALKFLTRGFAKDPRRLSLFREEVRNAREVSHPNVCRVHDIGEVDGLTFFSMEYIDGEDLASLLRRIGRLPGDKGIEVARQLCAGLAAAHERGLLHRDLKPANVMIDGRGRALITDFGLSIHDDKAEGGQVVGTPAYMAPEQRAGERLTARSDLYALGLVLHEMFTGRRPDAAGPGQLSGVDPAVARVIGRCLEADPDRRPATATAVAASLPGGDPMLAAIAAGETPSPEAVAGAIEVGALRPAWVIGLLVALGLGLLASATLAEATMPHRRVRLEKSPEVLTERAHDLIKRFAAPPPPVDAAWGFDRGDDGPTPAGLSFWYRQGPHPLRRIDMFDGGRVSASEPWPKDPGEIGLRLGPSGDLLRWWVIAQGTPTSGSPPWPDFFREAGLDLAGFRPEAPRGLPPSYADALSAWVEIQPTVADEPRRVEAASLGGRAVRFDVIAAGDAPRAAEEARQVTKLTVVPVWMAVPLVACGLWLSRRNVLSRRGDVPGGVRLAVVAGLLRLGEVLLHAHHPPRAYPEYELFLFAASRALESAAMMFVFYLAIDPFARRSWPGMLISWSRALRGRFNDPMFGRDLLVGTTMGVGIEVATYAEVAARSWFHPSAPSIAFDRVHFAFDGLLGVRYVLGQFGSLALYALIFGLGLLLILILVRTLVRTLTGSVRLALPVTYAFIMVIEFYRLGAVPWSTRIVAAASFAVFLAGFVRFGLVAAVASVWARNTLATLPVTTDLDAWYVMPSMAALGAVAALGIIASRSALAGRIPFVWLPPLDDPPE